VLCDPYYSEGTLQLRDTSVIVGSSPIIAVNNTG
jgi:hypothetical protein